MSLASAKFGQDEDVVLSGKAMRVAGFVQYEDANTTVLTRYLLSESAGAPAVLEEYDGQFFVLRPFLPTAQPAPSGRNLLVMGKKYTLSGVRKLKLLGTSGQPPGGTPKAELLLSGLFEGEMGTLVRDMTPGSQAQTFYSRKPLPANDALNKSEHAALREMEHLAAEARAQAESEDDVSPAGTSILRIAVAIATIVAVAGLGYACSGGEDEGSAPGSARSGPR